MHTLRTLLNVRESEWSSFVLLYTMNFIFVVGLIWASTIIEAAFLDQVGVEFLPGLFIGRALLSVPAVGLYIAFADRVDNSKLLLAILAIGILGIAAGLVLLLLGLVSLAYPLLWVVRFIPFLEIFAAHWYTYVNGFYDTRAAKRIVPVLETSGIMGAIVAGASLSVLTSVSSVEGIIFLWVLSLSIMGLLVRFLPAILPTDRASSTIHKPAAAPRAIPREPQRSYLENIGEGFSYTTQSQFLCWLAVSTLLSALLLTLLQFRTGQVMVAALPDTRAIAELMGLVIFVANVLILPIQLFLMSRIIGSVGLGNTSLIYPVGLFSICSGLGVIPGIPMAALSYFGCNDFYFTFGYPIQGLLYNAVPTRLKGRVRAFIHGLLVPFGGLLTGIFLLTPLPSVPWLLSVLLVGLAIAHAISSWLVRTLYSRALIALLQEEDLSFLLAPQDSTLMVIDPAMLQMLKARLDESTSPEFTIFMAQFIGQVARHNAIPILEELAATTPHAQVRSAVLDALVTADLCGESVRKLYVQYLNDPDPQVRIESISGLEHLAGSATGSSLAPVQALIQDMDVGVRQQALSTLARAGIFYTLPAAGESLEELLGSTDLHLRTMGIGVLGELHNIHALRRLITFLDDPADIVRLKVAVAIEAFPKTGLDPEVITLIQEGMRTLLGDPVARVRQSALQIIGQTETQTAAIAVLQALNDPSIQVRETAIDILVEWGKPAIPLLQAELETADPQRRKLSMITLCRIHRSQFDHLVDMLVLDNLRHIYSTQGLLVALYPAASYTSYDILQSLLRERNQHLLDEIFLALSASCEAEPIRLITEALHSDEESVRANATEALEALTNPHVASLIAALCAPLATPEQLLEYGSIIWNIQPPDLLDALRQNCSDEDAWLRMTTIFMLGEMAQSMYNREEDQRTNRTPESRPTRGTPDQVRGSLEQLPNESSRLRRRSSQASAAPQETASYAQRSSGAQDQRLLTHREIELLLQHALTDPVDDVRRTVQDTLKMLRGLRPPDSIDEEGIVLSPIERVVFLKGVAFFQGMTVEQLRVLATVCEEQRLSKDTRIINQGDTGGTLYVIVDGRVGIEQEKRPGYAARVATLGMRNYFGETNLFTNRPHTTSAIALQDTFTLQLRREPILALVRQYPELSLELIHLLSARLDEANNRIAELTRVRPNELNRLFDKFD